MQARSDTGTLLDDRYELGEVIGAGGMSVVRRALDRRLERPVAVKLLSPVLALDPAGRRRFEEEARAAAQISHPNVVAVYDSGTHDDQAYLVMECLSGRTLADEIAAGPLRADRLEAVAAALADGLAAAHRAGVLHRDIKPGNVLLDDDGTPKLADFGIAKAIDAADATHTAGLVGTAHYLAPERLAGEPATRASDVYSMGVVLYEAATGTRPFTADTPVGVALAIAHDDPVHLADRAPQLEPTLGAVIERAMHRDPDQRFASADDVRAALRDTPAAMPAARLAGPAPAGAPTVVEPRTRVLAAAPEPSRPPAEARARTWRPWALLAAGAITAVAALGLLVSSDSGRIDATVPPSTAASAPPTTAPSSLPAQLDDALRRLEQAVDR